MTDAIPNMVIAAMTTPSGQTAIEAVTKRNGRIFATYIVVLIITALVIAFFTWLTWDSGNQVQGAIMADADARIAEAGQRAADAGLTASQADERSRTLEQGNLKLQGDVNTQTAKVAVLEKEAANAKYRAAQYEAELERMRTPRSFTNASALTDALKMFKGTEYSFIGCFQDQESIDLLTRLDKALVAAGWTRKLPPQNSFGDLRLNISKDISVPPTTRSGIYVGAQSIETVDALKSTPELKRPPHITAAALLRGLLAAGINPPETDLATPLPVDSGSDTSVFIIVGKKP